MTTQEQRLNLLIKVFQEESPQYQEIPIPTSLIEKQHLLRAFMNVRHPHPIDLATLEVQDEYLTQRAQEKGIVRLEDIPLLEGSLSIWRGDITRLQVDAIVNAANEEMLGCFIPLHTCIDNQIHTYAGIELRQACASQMTQLRQQYGNDYTQPTGIPMLTDGYNLPARHIIHVVGPIVQQELTSGHEQALRDCYWNTLELCRTHHLKSVAFCCISTGVFHFPNKRAAQIAVQTVKEWQSLYPDALDWIIFNVFKEEDQQYYEALLTTK